MRGMLALSANMLVQLWKNVQPIQSQYNDRAWWWRFQNQLYR